MVIVLSCNVNGTFDTLSSFVIAWVYVRVVCINYEDIIILYEVCFMTISLVCIKINNHDPFNAMPFSDIMHHECDIWVNAKSTTTLAMSMMISPR